jgi:hypothetical protein
MYLGVAGTALQGRSELKAGPSGLRAAGRKHRTEDTEATEGGLVGDVQGQPAGHIGELAKR